MAAPTSPLLLLRAPPPPLLRRAAAVDDSALESVSRKAENPTVPLVLSGPSLEKSSCPDRLLAASVLAWGLDEGMTPIFCI